MKIRLSLSGRILLCAAANLVLLAAALAALMQAQLTRGLESALLAPTHNRLTELGSDIVRTMAGRPATDQEQITREFEHRLPLQLGVFLNGGTHVSGSLSRLPEAVKVHIMGGPPDPGPGPGRPLPMQPPPKGPRLSKGMPGGVPHPVHMVRTPEGYWFVVRIPVTSAGQDFPFLGSLIVFSRSLYGNPFLFDATPWVVGLLVVALITLLCWVPLIRYLTSSLHGVRQAAGRIAEGRFDERVKEGRGDEIAQLSDALNRMASQLDGFVHGQKRFLGDIAHELTAPIARLQAGIGILEHRATPESLPYVERVEDDIRHMAALVNELMNFSKMGLHPDAQPRVAQSVAEAAEEVIRREAPAEGAVRFVDGADLKVLAQPNSLTRALSNLVRNALRYAGDGGPITISASRVDQHVLIVVADQGPGLPEELLDRVFAPFYRVENSRSRQSGGAGLGLAIVKACVEASGGAVSCRNRSPRGLEVHISLHAA